MIFCSSYKVIFAFFIVRGFWSILNLRVYKSPVNLQGRR